MAVRPSETFGRLAVERARARMPDLAPDSIEVVELLRGHAYVVVRTAPSGVVVLDARGRLVRGRQRLTAIARHLRALAQVDHTIAQAHLDRRLEQTVRSAALLERIEGALADRALRPTVARIRAEIRKYQDRLQALHDDRARAAPATERTLRRTVSLLNEAARADRAVVRACRELGAALASSGAELATLRRWLVARLDNADLPFFYAELDEIEGAHFVSEFVLAARA